MDLSQVTTTQWATVAVGALASWLFLSWLSQPKSKHFKVPVPTGKTKKNTPRVWMTMTPNNSLEMIEADPSWKGPVLENPSIRVSIFIIYAFGIRLYSCHPL